MQLITLEKSQTTKLFWAVIALLMAVAIGTANQKDPGVTAAGGLLALVAVWPLYLWLLGSSHGLPIWPVFSLVTGVTYALPMIQNAESLSGYSATEVVMGGITTIGFIVLGTIIWLSLTSRMPKAPKSLLMIEQAHSVRYLLLFIGAGILFGVNQITNWFHFPGNTMPVARGIANSLNTMGLFVLAYYHGRGLLNRRDLVIFVAGAVATMLMNMTSLMLAQAIVPAAMVIFGYMLGSNKIPWKVLLITFFVMSLLHPGKYEMRRMYWSGEGEVRPLTLLTLPQFYFDWFNYGLQEVGGIAGVVTGPKDEDDSTSVFERSGNLHMLLLVQKKTPDEVPYFNGATYAPIPRLLIPRFLDDAKGISHAGNIMLTVNYGLQTIEQTQSTSIGWGLLPEAYANYGYLGIAGLAVVLALFYAWITNLTVGVPMTSLRFVLGLLVMGAATKADTMGIFVTSQFQGVVGVSLAALVLMKRRPNPFAASGGEGIRHTGNGIREKANGGRQGTGGRRQEAEGIRQTAYGKRQTANGIRREDGMRQKAEGRRQALQLGELTGRREDEGMPAPGVLAGLIEGAQPEGGGVADGMEHTADGMRHTADGGTVRTMPIRMPKRIASWMPRRVRAAVVAAARSAEEETGDGGQGTGEAVLRKDGVSVEGSASAQNGSGVTSGRPRQVAVPYRNYRRYRGA